MSETQRVKGGVRKNRVLEQFDRTTLWLTGFVLCAVSGWQAARSHNRDLPSIVDKDGNAFEQLVHATGQHFGPSWVVGVAAAAIYEKCRPQSTAPQQILAGTTGALAVNGIHEGFEVVAGYNVLGVPVKPEVSLEDVITGPGIVALAGFAAFALQKRESRK